MPFDVVVSADVLDTDELILQCYGISICFEKCRSGSCTPFLPVYNLSGAFIGLSRITVDGLMLLPLITHFTQIDDNPITLGYYKVYINMDASIAASRPFPLIDFSLDPSVKPVIAIPGSITEQGLGDYLSVHSLTLYNLVNNRVLSLRDLQSEESTKILRNALPYIDNVTVTGDRVEVRVSDGIFSLDEVMGTTEERSLWAMNYPSVIDDKNLFIDESSSEYRLICPQFSLRNFRLLEETGTTKLDIYNLPHCNKLYVDGDCVLSRTVHLYRSPYGNIAFCNNMRSVLAEQGELTILADDSIGSVLIQHVNKCNIKCNSCASLSLESVKSLNLSCNKIDRLRLSSVDEVSNIDLFDMNILSIHGQTKMTNATISGVKSGLLVYSSYLKNCSISHSPATFFNKSTIEGVELHDTYYTSIKGGSFSTTTLYMDNSSMLSLGVICSSLALGTINIKLSSNELNFCTANENGVPFGMYIQGLSDALKHGRPVDLTLDVHTSADEITIRHTVYMHGDSLKEMLGSGDIPAYKVSLLFLVVYFSGVRIILPKGTTAKLILDVQSLSPDMALTMHLSRTLYSEVPVEFQSSSMTFSSYDEFISEFVEECAEIGYQPSSYAITDAENVFKLFKMSGVTSIIINIPHNPPKTGTMEVI